MASFADALTAGYAPRLRRSVIDDVTGQPVVTSPPTGEIATRSTFFPVGVDDGGTLRYPVWPGFVTGAVEAAKLPGQVYRGEVSIFDPSSGRVSDEAIGRATDLAGLAMTGSMPFKAPAGALRSFGGAAAKADPLADLELALSKGIADSPQAPPAGPRRLDPNAASWDVYHGSTAGPDFRRFDPQASSNPAERGAVFFAPSPETASGYAGAVAQSAEAGNRVFRATVEPGRTKVFDLADMAENDLAFTARAREITMGQGIPGHGPLFDDYMAGFRASRAQDREIAAQLQQMGYAPGDPSPVSYGWGHIGAAVERAKAEGLDTAILRGLAEHGGDDQAIALTPGRVRSYYDPSQVLFSKLPAALGVGAAGVSMLAGGDEAQAAPASFSDALASSYRNR